MEKLNRAQKCSILGPQNLGSRGSPGPRAPPDPHLISTLLYSCSYLYLLIGERCHAFSPYGPKISQFHAVYLKTLAKLYVGAPQEAWRTSCREYWICPCSLLFISLQAVSTVFLTFKNFNPKDPKVNCISHFISCFQK